MANRTKFPTPLNSYYQVGVTISNIKEAIDVVTRWYQIGVDNKGFVETNFKHRIEDLKNVAKPPYCLYLENFEFSQNDMIWAHDMNGRYSRDRGKEPITYKEFLKTYINQSTSKHVRQLNFEENVESKIGKFLEE